MSGTQDACNTVLPLHPILYTTHDKTFRVTPFGGISAVCLWLRLTRDSSPPQCGSNTIRRFLLHLEPAAAEPSLEDLLKTGHLWRH